MRVVATAIIMLLLGAQNLYSHDPHPLQCKWENNLMIMWDGVSTDPAANQITISDGRGSAVIQLKVLRIVPDARRVTIVDVSANANLVAVAAIYQSKEKIRPAASLLLFNLRGELLSVLAIAPIHGISRLTVDDNSHIWTLTDGAGTEANPATVPMVVEYTVDGKVVREVLTRDKFPCHAEATREDVVMGRAEMGYSGVVWFWLPGSTELVTVSTSDGKATVMKTQLPKRQGRREVVLGITREPSGNLAGQFREDDAQFNSDTAHYVWSPRTGSWSEFGASACQPGRLIGTSDKGLVYIRFGAEGFEPQNLCTLPLQ